jgi:hypothetical protein
MAKEFGETTLGFIARVTTEALVDAPLEDFSMPLKPGDFCTFRAMDHERPRPGSIVLLQQKGDPAFVLRIYRGKRNGKIILGAANNSKTYPGLSVDPASVFSLSRLSGRFSGLTRDVQREAESFACPLAGDPPKQEEPRRRQRMAPAWKEVSP